MEYTLPNYYDQFSCIAGECEDSCCAGWEIVIDDKSMRKYMRFPGSFGNRLRNSIDVKEQTFHQYGHRCAFLNEENLCDIYEEAGPEYLCRTCRRYPRHVEEYENLREISLSLSCPEAARIILSQREPVRFRTVDKEGEETYDDFDYFLFSALMDVREVLFHILQKRELSISMRMAMSLSLCHDVQRRIQMQQLFGITEVLDRYQKKGAEKLFENTLLKKGIHLEVPPDDTSGEYLRKRREIIHNMLCKLYELEHLRDDWSGYLEHLESVRFGEEVHISSFHQMDVDEVMLEQILVYFVYTYFAGAVYDGKPYSKMKLAIYSTVMIREILLGRMKERGTLSFADHVEIAYRFAREIEHSDVNLNKLEQMFCKDEVFHLEYMLAVL